NGSAAWYGAAPPRIGRSRDDPRTALAEADRRIPVAPAMGSEDHLIAVCQIGAGLAGMEGDRALAGVAQLAQAAVALGGRPRDRAAAENIAGQQVAAAAGVVRDELRDGPVKVQRVAARHPVRREALLAHLRGQQ